MNKPKILVVGSSHAGSGIGRVLHSLLNQLSPLYCIHQLELSTKPGIAGEVPWRVYPAQQDGPVLRLQALENLVDRVKPDLIFIYHDLWDLARYAKLPCIADGMVKSVAYCPIDTPLRSCERLQDVRPFDCLVTFTEFARQQLEAAFGELDRDVHRRPIPQLAVVPHGVDTSTFYPLCRNDFASSRKRARQQLFPDHPEWEDAFIVLNGNRNQPRKRIDLTVEGFSKFARGKPDHVKLYLHMGLIDRGHNLIALANKYGIRDRLLLTSKSEHPPCVSDQKLNLIYNACDVGINTSGGEGWGLVSFEHAATGAAQIVPGHTGCRELWTDRGVTLPSKTTHDVNPLHQTEDVSPDDVADSLQRFYDSPSLLRQFASHAFLNANQPAYQWKAIGRQFDAVFQATLAESSKFTLAS
ncbi:MAG: glycosyltransferase [Pirellulales bacterium]|nr:glycosyltransferase [Pirellulales bacterium]